MPNSPHALDGGGAALDPRCVDQHQHGAVPRVRGRPAARGPAHPGLRDAEPLHRPRRGDRVRAALDADERLRRREHRGAGHDSPEREALLLRRRGGVPGRGALDDRHHEGVSARGHGGVPAPRRPSGAGSAAGAARDRRRDRARCPTTMRQLAWVQVCTWLGLFCMWLYFPVAVARNVFGAPDETSPLYQRGVEWGGLCFAMYSVGLLRASRSSLPRLARAPGPQDHAHRCACSAGRAGLLSVAVIHDQYAAAALDGRRRDRLGEHPVHALRDPRRLAARRTAPASTWASSTSSS